MLFIYIRHGEPIYEPDDLTELGRLQAEAVAKRLAEIGVDKFTLLLRIGRFNGSPNRKTPWQRNHFAGLCERKPSLGKSDHQNTLRQKPGCIRPKKR